MFEIAETVTIWLKAGTPIALATVVETWGSSPRQAGAKMAVTDGMAMIGSVSGGCVETAVIAEMIDALNDRRPRLLTYGVSDDDAWNVGLACGGKVTVYAEPLDPAWWGLLNAHLGQSFTQVTVLSGEHAGLKALVGDAVHTVQTMPPEVLHELVSAAQSCRTTTRTTAASWDVLIEVHRPQPTLIIIGGAHVALALRQYADILGFRVMLIDPRSAFATPERFPNVAQISHQYPDKALADYNFSQETYVAVLTHDPKIDDPALRTVLPQGVAYVGILSSRRTHKKRIERLTAAGMARELFGQVHTPIGLDIGAQTPEEIALAIMAEIVAVRNRKPKA